MSKQKKQILLFIVFVAFIIAIRDSSEGSILTFGNLKQHRDILPLFLQDRDGSAIIPFIMAYIFTTALFIPGAVTLTLAGGFPFGTAIAAVYIKV